MDVLGRLVDFVELDDIRVIQLPHNIYFLEHRCDVPFAFLDAALFYGLQGIFGIRIILSETTMDLGEVTSAQQWAQHELVFEIKQNARLLQDLDPLGDLSLVCVEELKILALGHEDESEKLCVLLVLDVRLLESGVLDVEHPSLNGVVVVVELNQLVRLGDVHEVLLFEVS